MATQLDPDDLVAPLFAERRAPAAAIAQAAPKLALGAVLGLVLIVAVVYVALR